MGLFEAIQQPSNTSSAAAPRRGLFAEADANKFSLAESLLSTPEYAAAGSLNQALGGEAKLLSDRPEFGDILRERGVPEPLAAMGGLFMAAFNPADPLNYIPIPFAGRFVHGLVDGAVRAGRGGRMYKALEKIAAQAGEMPESIRKIAADVPDLAAARAKIGETASNAAREKFALTMGNETRETAPELFKQAKLDAKAAAADARKSTPRDLAESSDPLGLGNLYDKTIHAFGDRPWVKGADVLVKQAQHTFSWYVRNLADNMRTNKHAWGERGAEMAAKFEHSQALGAMSEGQGQALLAKLTKGLTNAELENVSDVIEGSAQPLSDKIAEIAVKAEAYKKQLFDDLLALGVKQKVPPEHSLGQNELFPAYAEERKRIARLQREGKDWPLVPIQYRANHIYKIRSERVVNAMLTEGSPQRAEAIKTLREYFSESVGSNKDAAELLDDALKDSYDPISIRGGPTQHTRDDLLDVLGIPYEKNFKTWMTKYIHLANKRAAQAAVFGGEDQVWHEYFEQLGKEGGDIKLADDTWRAFVSRPTSEQATGSKLFQFVRTLQTFRLGPRVGALQFLQLANTASMFGSANTGRAIGALMRNKKLGRAAEQVGALLPSQHMSYDASELDNFSSWWLTHITRMPQADRTQRVIASVSAGFRLNQVAEQLAVAKGARRRVLERELYQLGVDAKALADQDYAPSIRQVQTAMQRGAKLTQFTTDITDLPAAVRHNTFFRTMFIFRGYAKQQSTFINRIVREARRGNIKPALRYASAFTGMYNLMEPLLMVLQGKVDEDPARDGEIEDYLKALMYTGSLGAFGDYLNTAGDTGKLLKGQAGPAIGAALDLGTAAPAALSGDWEPAEDAARRALIPGGLGTILHNLNE